MHEKTRQRSLHFLAGELRQDRIELLQRDPSLAREKIYDRHSNYEYHLLEILSKPRVRIPHELRPEERSALFALLVPYGGRIIAFLIVTQRKQRTPAEKLCRGIESRQPGSKRNPHHSRYGKIRECKKSETYEACEEGIENGTGCTLQTRITFAALQHVPTEHTIVEAESHEDEEAYCRKEVSSLSQ